MPKFIDYDIVVLNSIIKSLHFSVIRLYSSNDYDYKVYGSYNLSHIYIDYIL